MSEDRDGLAPGADLLALDVLLRPDAEMDALMRTLNARLRRGYPQGYALDDSRIPHVTLVQAYVRREHFDDAAQATGDALAGCSVPRQLLATGYDFSPGDAWTTVSIALERNALLEDLQAALVAALAPFTSPAGNGDAFVRDADEAPIELSTIEYVRDYVRCRTGEGFEPHITVGRAAHEDARQLGLETFRPHRFGVAEAAIHQLGNAGTARRRLDAAAPAQAGK